LGEEGRLDPHRRDTPDLLRVLLDGAVAGDLPIFATLRIDILVHVAWSRYVRATQSWQAT
jgi:hypothetical protein